MTAARSSVSIAAADVERRRRRAGRARPRGRPRRRRSGCGRRRGRSPPGRAPSRAASAARSRAARAPSRAARSVEPPPDLARRAPRALGEQLAEALARADQLDRRAAAPSPSPKRSHGASIRPRSTHSIAQAIVPPARDRVDAEVVAPRAGARAPRRGRRRRTSGPSANTFSYSTRVLPPSGRRVDVLAADRARRAAVARDVAQLVQLLGGERAALVERRRAGSCASAAWRAR